MGPRNGHTVWEDDRNRNLPGHADRDLVGQRAHQTAYQVITFNVGNAGTGHDGGYAELVYSAGEWNVIYTDPVEPEGDDLPMTWIVAGILAVAIIGIIVARSVL